MKTAIDFYDKEKEANADDYDRSLFYSKERFICPECGYSVHLTGRKNNNYFSHYKKSADSAECDRRVDGDPIDSVYKRIGLPLYLKSINSKEFQLYMAFKPVSETILDKATKDNVKITIDNKSVFQINNERFSNDSITLIPIDFIPSLLGSDHLING